MVTNRSGVGLYPKTGFAEISSDVREEDFRPARVKFRIAQVSSNCRIPSDSDLPTASPWDGFVFPARERTGRTIRAEQRNPHNLARAIFDRGRALISVEVRLREARGH